MDLLTQCDVCGTPLARELADVDQRKQVFDNPVVKYEQWKHARRGQFYRPVKQQITARDDADVLDWLKRQGRGYQSRINAILKREMLHAAKQR